MYVEKNDSQRNKYRLKEILKHKTSGTLLEIGCAQGGFLKLAKEHFDVEGIDVSEFAVNCAKKDHNVWVGDIQKIKLEENKYDVIVIFNVLEHLKNPSLAIANIYSALKKGGIVIGSMPNKAGVVGRVFTHIGNYIDKTHCSTYTPKKWERLFKKEDFNVYFFGELMASRNNSKYVKGKHWKHFSFNLMFLCKK